MPGGEFCEEEKLLPGHIIVSSNSFYHIVMYVHVCTCDFGEEGGEQNFSIFMANYKLLPPYSMKELGCINSVHTLFSECAK